MKRAHGFSVASAAIVAAVSACTLIDAPRQCASDADCARFGALCSIAEGVCVERDTKTTQGAKLPADTVVTKSGPPPTTTVEPPAPSPTTTPLDDAGLSDAARSDGALPTLVATITCGATTCPVGADSMCCITDGTPKCSTAAECAGSRVRCDDTSDCAALGLVDTICCGFNDGAAPPKLLRARCVPSSQCDANGPQDQLCKVDGPADQCTVANDGRTKCAPFTYENSTDYAFCVAP